jgi:hypothetical protein
VTEEEQNAVLMFPVGHRFTLLWIAYVKHMLVTYPKMPAGYRLQFLEWVDGEVCMGITHKMLEMIEPMSDTEIKMMNEALALDRKDDPAGLASARILTGEVFEDFLKLNPSLLAAIVLHHKDWNPAPAALQPNQQDEQQFIPPASRDWQWAKQFNPVRIR